MYYDNYITYLSFFYFHIFQNPIPRMFDGNHFAYMHPIQYLPEQNVTSQLNLSTESDPKINKVPSLINEDLTKDVESSDRLSCPNVEDDISEDSSGSIADNTESFVFDDTQNTVFDLCATIDRENPLNKCFNVINRTHALNSKHKACICVVCDCFIIGTEKFVG